MLWVAVMGPHHLIQVRLFLEYSNTIMYSKHLKFIPLAET